MNENPDLVGIAEFDDTGVGGWTEREGGYLGSVFFACGSTGTAASDASVDAVAGVSTVKASAAFPANMRGFDGTDGSFASLEICTELDSTGLSPRSCRSTCSRLALAFSSSSFFAFSAAAAAWKAELAMCGIGLTTTYPTSAAASFSFSAADGLANSKLNPAGTSNEPLPRSVHLLSSAGVSAAASSSIAGSSSSSRCLAENRFGARAVPDAR